MQIAVRPTVPIHGGIICAIWGVTRNSSRSLACPIWRCEVGLKNMQFFWRRLGNSLPSIYWLSVPCERVTKFTQFGRLVEYLIHIRRYISLRNELLSPAR